MAKRITDEDLRLNLIINGDAGKRVMLALDRQMNDLQGTVKKMRNELKALEKAGKTGSAEYQRLTAALSDQEKALNKCRDKYNKLQSVISLENKTLAELRNHLRATSAALSKAVPGTENWKNLNAEVQRTRTRLKELTDQSKAVHFTTCEMMDKISKYAISIASALRGASEVINRFSASRDAFLAYDEAMTDAMKTTGLTKEEITATITLIFFSLISCIIS